MNQGPFGYVDLRIPPQPMDIDMDTVGLVNDTIAIVDHVLEHAHHLENQLMVDPHPSANNKQPHEPTIEWTMPSDPLDEMGSINDHAVEVEQRGIQRQLEDFNHHGSPNGG